MRFHISFKMFMWFKHITGNNCLQETIMFYCTSQGHLTTNLFFFPPASHFVGLMFSQTYMGKCCYSVAPQFFSRRKWDPEERNGIPKITQMVKSCLRAGTKLPMSLFFHDSTLAPPGYTFLSEDHFQSRSCVLFMLFCSVHLK